MAELSTIARPYAQGLMKAVNERKVGEKEVAKTLEVIDALALISSDAQLATLAGDPKLSNDQLFEIVTKTYDKEMPEWVVNLLKIVIENGRLSAMPEIARQFRELKNLSEGIADAYIETAFELTKEEINELLTSLDKKFPGVKLNPIVTVNTDLIGGVCIRVGDQLLDGSVRARLNQMKTTLTA